MLHKRSAALILAVSLPALAGCVQATRHSNTMVFGTNTSLAARVGQGVNQIPEVSVGYARQEAVIMPLLANTGDKGDRRSVLSPCGNKTTTGGVTTSTLTATDGRPHPCKFVATKTNNQGIVSQDSYSVLASFGANIKARSPGSGTENAEIGVGIAQYFATGVAAQLLASNGGAAVVSVSAGATKSAESTRTGKATEAVTGTKGVSGFDPSAFRTSKERLEADLANAASGAERKQIIETALADVSMDPVDRTNTANACEESLEKCHEALKDINLLLLNPSFIYPKA